jgi:hypothetical protein
MEREISDLRGQLTHAISASGEVEELRRGIERSERQRAQLSDHIEVGLGWGIEQIEERGLSYHRVGLILICFNCQIILRYNL